MARIQVLPLTTRTVDGATETPFVIVIDGTADALDDYGNPLWTDEVAARVKAGTGAVGLLLCEQELTVANVDEELHRAAQAAVEHALYPERTVEVGLT